MHTPLCDMFGIEYPIFAFSHCRDVVVAVSRAGGLGVLGAVGYTPEQLEIELTWIDDHIGGKPYGVDTVMPASKADVGGKSPEELMTQIKGMIPEQHKQYVEELMARFDLPAIEGDDAFGGVLGWTDAVARGHVDVALAHPIALLANALGSPPLEIIERAHAQGVKIAALAGAARHAKHHVDNGVDVIVAQGWEAGGHTGEIATMVLIPEVVKVAGDVPVLGAGGIGSGGQVAAVMAMGAQGAWTGSLWLTTAESDSAPEIKERYLEATSADTVRSRCYTGKPARQLRSPWTDAWEPENGPGALGMPLQNILTSEANARIARSHRKDLAFTPVGQIVGSMNEVRPVREVMHRLVEQYIESVEGLAKGLGLGIDA